MTDRARIDPAAVPEGWGPVAELCAAVLDDLDAIAVACAAEIRVAVPAYVGPDVLERELEASVATNMEVLLVAVAEHRDPDPTEIGALRELGARRARQGMRVSDVNEAFHIGYRHVWEQLVQRAAGTDEATRTMLLDAATTMWSWTHHTGDALGASHAAVVNERSLQRAALGHRLLELLGSEAGEPGELVLLASTLGFAPEGRFRLHVHTAEQPVGEVAQRIQTGLDALDGVHHAVARGTVLTVVSQEGEAGRVDAVVRRHLPTTRGGVGRCRRGLAGARTSLGDATMATGVACPGTTSRFDDDWLWAVLTDEADRLDDVVARAVEVAEEHPALAETVVAFAAAGFSPSRAGEALFVHANTVAYRLRRWQELTGWDPRDFEGLTWSMAAIRLRGRR